MQANSTLTTSPNRRNMLAGVAAVAALVPASAVASAVCPSDPVFTAIEGHRHARATFSESLSRVSRFQEGNRPSDGRLPTAADHPELAELERQASDASDRETDATIALLTTPPATLAGAVAVLRYIQDGASIGDDYLQTYVGECLGYDALVSSLIAGIAPLVQQ
jgi:hypothetical protein